MKQLLFLISCCLFIFMTANCADTGETYPWEDAGGDIPTYDINFGDTPTYDVQWDFGTPDAFMPPTDAGQDTNPNPGPTDTGPRDISGDINTDAEHKDHGPDAVVEWDTSGNCELFQDATVFDSTIVIEMPNRDSYYKNGSDLPPGQNHFTPPKIDQERWDNTCTDIGENGSPDHVYKFTFNKYGVVDIRADCTASVWGFDCISYFVRKDGPGCALTQADITLDASYCSNDSSYWSNDEYIKAFVNKGDYYYLLDGYDGDSGEYELTVDFKHFVPCNSLVTNPWDVLLALKVGENGCIGCGTNCIQCSYDNATGLDTSNATDKFYIRNVPYTVSCIDSPGAPDHIWAIFAPISGTMKASVTKKGSGSYDLSVFIVLGVSRNDDGYLCAPKIGQEQTTQLYEDEWVFLKDCDYNFGTAETAVTAYDATNFPFPYYVIIDGEETGQGGPYELKVWFE